MTLLVALIAIGYLLYWSYINDNVSSIDEQKGFLSLKSPQQQDTNLKPGPRRY